MTTEDKCPFPHGINTQAQPNEHWWPNQLNLRVPRGNSPAADPMDEEFNYAEEFATLDLDALKKDVMALMTTPRSGGRRTTATTDRSSFAWRGTVRAPIGFTTVAAVRASGTQRFAPLNSWPDNVNLDKARRLLWPIKQKYGRKISWADLMILAGTLALESMGMKTYGFAGGRDDVWEADEDIYWGPEDVWLGDQRYSGDRELQKPLGAVQMGLIYVNPEGPNGTPDPLARRARHSRDVRRMAMNDEETVALIAGGHTFGKTHGAADARTYVGANQKVPPRAPGTRLEEQLRRGQRGATRSRAASRARGPRARRQWDNSFFDTLFGHEWEQTKSPAGATQWEPKDGAASGRGARRLRRERRSTHPVMLTTDLVAALGPDLRAHRAALPRAPRRVRTRLRARRGTS